MKNKKPLSKKKTFLVTNNDKASWEANSRLAFISDSTPDYLDAEWLKTIDHIVLDGPWNSIEYRRKSREFVVERVVNYRKELYPILNKALGLEYVEKTWGILLDSWLMHFLSIIYDRLNKLENAKEKLGDFFIKCSDENNPCMSTTLDFVVYCTKDYGNKQLYCDIAFAIGANVNPCFDFPQEKKAMSQDQEINIKKKNTLYFSLKLIRFLVRLWIKYRKPLVILNGYFSKRVKFFILLRSLGKVLMIPNRMLFDKSPDFNKKNESIRNLLQVTENDKYDLVANKLIKKYFPISLLENLKSSINKVSRLSVIPVLGSAGGFFYDEDYKILASQLSEKGNKIIGFQHGGNYSFEKSKFFVQGYFEKLGVDKFYKWKEKSLRGKFLPSTKLEWISSFRERRRKGSNSDILFVSFGVPRFVFRQEADNADGFVGHITEQQKFYLMLDKKISRHFLLRPYMRDFGWRIKERWLGFTKGEIRFDPNPQFYESLVSCRLYVSQHISTTWLEAFFCDVPVVLFFDPDHYFASDEVKSLFKELQAVGIYHTSVESAASFVNERYESIEKWWEMPETKSASDKIKNYFLTTSNNFTKEWTQELVALRDRILKDKLNQGALAGGRKKKEG